MEKKKCYYEILGVDRKASVDIIRTAYKKQALLCHPDKNHGNVEAAEARFKELQNAYTILSDPDERAWYDSHRESILHGEGGASAPEEVNLYDYFSSACYNGLNDDENGFFAVYRGVFDRLVDEESDHNASAASWPRFGESSTSWESVYRFYNHWRNFSSFKNFAWKDEYKTNEIDERFSRRAAERVNQKVRAAAKKEYIQTVHSLVQFVHKRDPRVKAEQQRQEKENAVKEADKNKKEAERIRRRREVNEKIWAEAAEQESREEAERAQRGDMMDGTTLDILYQKQRDVEDMRRGKGKTSDTNGFAMLEGDDDTSATDFRCAACKKSFKTNRLYDEHVKSNKHKTKIKQLAGKGVDVEALMKTTEDQQNEE